MLIVCSSLLQSMLKISRIKHAVFLFIFIAFLVIPFFVFAQGSDTSGIPSPENRLNTVAQQTYPGSSAGSIEETVSKAINAILGLTGMIFFVYMIYGGYLWMTANGKEENVEKAKHIIRNSIIGLVIILGAYAISNYVVSAMLGGSSGTNATTG